MEEGEEEVAMIDTRKVEEVGVDGGWDGEQNKTYGGSGCSRY